MANNTPDVMPLAVRPVILRQRPGKGKSGWEIILPAVWRERKYPLTGGKYALSVVQDLSYPRLVAGRIAPDDKRYYHKREVAKLSYPGKETGGRIRILYSPWMAEFLWESWFQRLDTTTMDRPLPLVAMLYPYDILILSQNKSHTDERILIPEGAEGGERDDDETDPPAEDT